VGIDFPQPLNWEETTNFLARKTAPARREPKGGRRNKWRHTHQNCYLIPHAENRELSALKQQ